jgi:hypothetical protein
MHRNESISRPTDVKVFCLRCLKWRNYISIDFQHEEAVAALRNLAKALSREKQIASGQAKKKV